MFPLPTAAMASLTTVLGLINAEIAKIAGAIPTINTSLEKVKKLTPTGKAIPTTPSLPTFDLTTLFSENTTPVEFDAVTTITKCACDSPIPSVTGLGAILILVKMLIQYLIDELINWIGAQVHKFITGLINMFTAIGTWWTSFKESLKTFCSSCTNTLENALIKSAKAIIKPIMALVKSLNDAIKTLKDVLEQVRQTIETAIEDIATCIQTWNGTIRCMQRLTSATYSV